jgi:ABC-type Fe3+/spermidine/putrescine transport system ATPase subunit
MQTELKRLQRETSITFVLVTHDQGEAMAMGDQVAVFDSGRIVQIGAPEEVYLRPRTAFVADFIGEANLVSAMRSGGTVSIEGLGDTDPGALANPDAEETGSVTLAIRPENVVLTQTPDGAGVVTDVTFVGGDIHVDVDLGQNRLVVRIPSHGARIPQAGSRVHLAFLPESLRIMADS